MASKRDYLDRLQVAVQEMHKCGAHWLRTEPVHETSRGKTVWRGEVEVFGLIGHAKTKRAYAWSHKAGDKNERFVAVLELPPVTDPQSAVKVAIAAEVENAPK
jgi:hypothetical protein